MNQNQNSARPAFGGATMKGASMRVSGAENRGFGGGRGGGRGGRGGGPYRKTLNQQGLNRGNNGGGGAGGAAPSGPTVAETSARSEQEDRLDAQMGFPKFQEGPDRLGWLLNFAPCSVVDESSNRVLSAIACYFQCQDGSMFKAKVPFAPYMYVQVRDGLESEVESYVRRRFEGHVAAAEVVEREDLDLKNHLAGIRRPLLKLSFFNVQQLMDVRRELQQVVHRKRWAAAAEDVYQQMEKDAAGGSDAAPVPSDFLEAITDLRESDVPYHVRFCIDTDVRGGRWYTVSARQSAASLVLRADLLQRAEPRIVAFDIETTKLPLQFPNSEFDQVFMISYMVDRQGYLIVNREIVGADIQDFEYTPKPEFEGPFIVFNEPDERSLLRAWLQHMKKVRPGVYVTYNGDYFDWPFLEVRCAKHGLDMAAETGFKVNPKSQECLSRAVPHLDAFAWVNRDSYLPQGSRGLKAVTKYKLGYDPVEVDPEDMVRMAQESPQSMASYSVSDAVATYYLYMTYIHPFIFSLSTIIPMTPDEVLRKGSGTLCEMLLMVQASKANVVAPNKHTSETEKFYNGHLLESETYIGGHVECLESGVFRADLEYKFRVKPQGYQYLLDHLDRDLEYALKHEAKMDPKDVTNYASVRGDIAAQLADLRDRPVRDEKPLIYHLDVAAMYPNIILTNRLQPSAIVTDEDCAACDFNRPDKGCLRTLEWVWRGDTYSCTRSEYHSIKAQLESERFPGAQEGEPHRYFSDLPKEEQRKKLDDRLKRYCQKVYKRVQDKPVTEVRSAGICQRENSFYIDTVRSFRDRRYEYKALQKVWKKKLDEAKAAGSKIRMQEAEDMCVLYESLQLAHKCILNSFYGYVMRKGARWYSMEMAGVVTYTGAKIIQRAAALIGQLGRPLELDTDGIWCALPASFPENYKFEAEGGKSFKISYPCSMLNAMVAEHNTNPQYQTLIDRETHEYKTSAEMSIEFEVDGPYLAMVLPASQAEGKSIKKRYAVFNFDGSIAEIKGFELKRRGELKLIKVFQAEVFEQFLKGLTLEECYQAVGAVANRWLDMLDTRGVDLSDSELLDLISESCTMSKSLEEYEGRKSCAITTAKRLASFLGDDRIKDKGLSAHYIVASKPEGQPTSEKAIPVAIFSTEPSVARAFLQRWTKCADVCVSGEAPDPRDIIDWVYYKERLGNAIQKIITIPAAFQHVPTPVPRVKHPDWLHKRVREREDKFQQRKIDAMFAAAGAAAAAKPASGPGGAAAAAVIEEELERHRPEGVEEEEEGAEVEGGQARLAPEELDMEDMGTSFGAAKRLLAQTARDLEAGTLQALEAEAEEEEDAAVRARGGEGAGASEDPDRAPLADRQEDFGSWLRQQKRRWLSERDARKKKRDENSKAKGRGGAAGAADAAVAAAALGPAKDLGTFFRRQQAAAAHSSWQVLSIAETLTPGLFRAWIMVGGGGPGSPAPALYSVPLRIPRTLYVNAAVGERDPAPPLPFAVRRVTRQLPHGDEAQSVFEASLDEAEYRRNGARLALQLADRRVLGLYETRLPLGLSAAWQLGCVVSVHPAARGRPLGEEFSLTELSMKGAASGGAAGSGYLEGAAGDRPHQISLYHALDEASGRGVLMLYLWTLGEATVCVISPNASAVQDVSGGFLERAWRELDKGLKADAVAAGQTAPEPLPKSSFAVHYTASMAQAARTVQRALATAREQLRGPAVLLSEGPRPSSRLRHSLPLLDSFPCVDIPPNAADSEIPPLGWQQRVARTAAARAAMSREWLEERLAAARYAQLPVGNLGADWLLATMDTLFARCLREQGHLLWAQDEALPDLGRAAPSLLEAAASSEDKLRGTSLNQPGAYRTVCCELKVLHLAVNALDKSALLGDLEGVIFGDEGNNAVGPAFRVLKTLVSRLLDDATRRGNPMADLLLRHLYRWLSSPSSALHDALLQKAVASLTHKLFLHLVAEIKKLGATVIHADSGTITICTGKRNLRAAMSHVDYLLAALRRKELFSWVSLVPSQWWHALLWRDPYNWAGIDAAGDAARLAAEGDKPPQPAGEEGVVVDNETGPLEGNLEDDFGDEEAEAAATAAKAAKGGKRRRRAAVLEDEDDEPEWGAQEEDEEGEGEGDGNASAEEEDGAGGPKGEGGDEDEPELRFQWNLAEHLPSALRDYFYVLVSEFLLSPWRHAREAARVAIRASRGGTQAALEARAAEEVMTAHLNAAMSGAMTDKILSLAKDMQRHIGSASEDPTHQFPRPAGSYLTRAELGEPALAFVRTVCHVLGLDHRVEPLVARLRKNALALLQVKEHSAAAEFRDPCMTHVLRDVICSYCNDCRDLDLCRDQDVQEGKWRCRVPSCQQPYERGRVEARLLEAVRRRAAAYATQDLRCRSCRQVRVGHFSYQCGCGGDLANDQAPPAYRRWLSVVNRLGAQHGFATLQEATAFLLEGEEQPQQA